MQCVEAVLRYLQGEKLRIHIGAQFPLMQAAEVHELVESRSSTGKIVLTV
ncbi:zinc-binding dehydrogenase [Ectobacillus sp. JY-23]|nr:zinc-binding dehydrogenase [Ectobacillus sp. JY-23]UOY93086.1 zinc-binding dehydrogenase [Ectobacillus sp. JY-23]